MRGVRLRRRDPARNMDRFYSQFLRQTLFGDHVVTREWGRVGQPGTVREEWFPDAASAVTDLERRAETKRARGYLPG
jgi:predicted DNA-binding WGR domain protein